MRPRSPPPLSVLLLAFTFAGGCGPPPAGSAAARAGPRTVRVATWNVHDLFDAEDRLIPPGEGDTVLSPAAVEAKLARVAAVLARLDADVVVLEEVENLALLRAIADRAGYAEARLVEGNDPRGIDVGALSRLPVRAYRSHRLERDAEGRLLWPRDCVELEVDAGGGRALRVVASHLSSALSDDGTRRRSQAARLREIADAARAGGARVVAGGDLNDAPGSAALGPLLADGAWRDPAGGLPAALGWTWSGGGRREVLDLLLVPAAEAGEVADASVLAGADVTAASDHRPVVLDLRIWVAGGGEDGHPGVTERSSGGTVL